MPQEVSTLVFNTFLIITLMLVVFGGYVWYVYNMFIHVRNQVKTDFADVDVYLKRRASLIDNLVAVVKEYAKHEKETFTGVAKARSALEKPHGPKEAAHAENVLTETLRSLFAVSENYPDLKASENFKRLQDDLKETEDIIARHRETYNQSVMKYNTKLQIFPHLIVAGLFRFEEEEFFDPGITGRADARVDMGA